MTGIGVRTGAEKLQLVLTGRAFRMFSRYIAEILGFPVDPPRLPSMVSSSARVFKEVITRFAYHDLKRRADKVAVRT